MATGLRVMGRMIGAAGGQLRATNIRRSVHRAFAAVQDSERPIDEAFGLVEAEAAGTDGAIEMGRTGEEKAHEQPYDAGA